ncbi:hypothetical protein CYY_003691 [Polysphondylium violaceum]|uniref:non-specific serine/threonine protein kinase n=1 Tax=Polysphondylium violaceum TaxID=133409 RepID=A0A8J4PWD9_9MYCE|nr:hypothetical protein CYY_003691 [Polysphondylium violaceum]
MNKYTIVKLIGSGGEAKALLVKKNGTENLYVLKQRDFLHLEQANDGLNEAMSLARIQSPNIVKFEEVFIYYNNEVYSLCIVMEYCDGGDLMEFMFNSILENNDSFVQQGDINKVEFMNNYRKGNSNTHTISSYSDTSDSASCSGTGFATTPTVISPAMISKIKHKSTEAALKTLNEEDDDRINTLVDDFESGPTSPPSGKTSHKLTLSQSVDKIEKTEKIEKIEGIKKSKSSWWRKKTNSKEYNNNSINHSTTMSSTLSSDDLSTHESSSKLTTTTQVDSRPCIPKKLLFKWIYQIACGVHAIHSQHTIHRDLKSENIFITEYSIKIGDFGLATTYDTSIKGMAGTYYYSSPEVLQNKEYCRPADIFSLGCIYYEMCTMRLLPLAKRCIADELIQGKFDKKAFLAEFTSENLQMAELILSMLDMNPNVRPSIDSILQNQVFNPLKRTNSMSVFSNALSPELTLGSLSIQPQHVLGFRRQLEKSDLAAAAEILSEAYRTEPRFIFVSGGTSNNAGTIAKSEELGNIIRKNFFEMALRVMFANKFMLWGFFNSENVLNGVACWASPGKKRGLPVISMIVNVISLVPKFGLRVMKKIGTFMSCIERAIKKSKADDGSDQYHLAYCGISRECRNNGIGQYLLKPVLEWADFSGKKVKTLALNLEGINFLSKQGFVVIYEEKTGLPKGIDSIYIMERDPKPR